MASECRSDEECPIIEIDDLEVQLTSLRAFAGGYCGIQGCENNLECPEGASCVAHTDGQNYCFRACHNKIECNLHRPHNEANCSANFEFADPSDDDGRKVCIPPSSGE